MCYSSTATYRSRIKISFSDILVCDPTYNHQWARKLNIGNGLSNFELELHLASRVAYFDKLKPTKRKVMIMLMIWQVHGYTIFKTFHLKNTSLPHLMHPFESRALKNALFHVKFFLVQLFPRLWSQKVILHCTYLLLSFSLYFLFQYLGFEE